MVPGIQNREKIQIRDKHPEKHISERLITIFGVK
jgi:hypothetical protein